MSARINATTKKRYPLLFLFDFLFDFLADTEQPSDFTVRPNPTGIYGYEGQRTGTQIKPERGFVCQLYYCLSASI